MESERITELLRVHGNMITWETHLKFVEKMSHWEPEEILDYQESLVDHLCRGAWISTSQNRVVQTAMGSFSADRLAAKISIYETLLGADGTLPEQRELWRTELDSLGSWRPAPRVETVIEPGTIGVPFHPWTMDPKMERHYQDPVKERGVLVRFMNDERYAGINTHELRLVLRAAPWAYFRRTGERVVGVEPCALEEFERTGHYERFTTVITLHRGIDSVEYLAFGLEPSAASAAADPQRDFAAFAKLLGASISRIESRAIDGIAVERRQQIPLDSLVISDRPADREEASPNALSLALGTLLFTRRSERGKHPRLAEDAFWKLVALIDEEMSDASISTLTSALAKKPIKSIVGFHETLTDILFRLDRPELTRSASGSDPSVMRDDVFLYFRCAVVAAGEVAVSSVLDAGNLVESDWRGDRGEALLGVAARAFELKCGEPFEHETELSCESGSNVEAWGGDVVPTGDLAIAAYSVRSLSLDADGTVRERVRYWTTSSRDEAIESHNHAERELWGEAYQGVLDAVPFPDSHEMSVTKALGRVSYYRPLSNEVHS